MRYALLLSLAMIAADPVEDPAAKLLESSYQTVAQKADTDATKLKKVANEKRLKGYRDLLKTATKAGDFKRATTIQARLVELEEEKDAIGADRPAGSVRHGNHTYLLVTDELSRTRPQ